MDERKQRSLWRTILSICSLALIVLVLSACTVGGDDDDSDATEEATETVVAAEISTPASNNTIDDPSNDSTPIADSTPTQASGVIATPDAGGGSPTPEIVVSAPPVSVPDEEGDDASAQASPEAGTDTSSLIGALQSVVGDDETDTTEFESSTPVAVATGAETTVTSCDDVAPALEGGTETWITNSDVNFRDGPGTDCDPILAEPLGEGAVVEVLSEPVVREGDDENLWVAVSVDGTDGWLATEFIDPAE